MPSTFLLSSKSIGLVDQKLCKQTEIRKYKLSLKNDLGLSRKIKIKMFASLAVFWIGEGQNDQKRTKSQILYQLPRLSKIGLDNRGKSQIKSSRCTYLGDFYHPAKFQVNWTYRSKVMLTKRNRKSPLPLKT